MQQNDGNTADFHDTEPYPPNVIEKAQQKVLKLRKDRLDQKPGEVMNGKISVREDFDVYEAGIHTIKGHIEFETAEGKSNILRIWGVMTPFPKDGDVVKTRMNSGRVGLFVLANIHNPNEPDTEPDLFIGEGVFIGYEDENLHPKLSAPIS